MNSNDFDDWNREAIISAALEYRGTGETYRGALIHAETRLARVTADHDQLREALERLLEYEGGNHEWWIEEAREALEKTGGQDE
jgi:hypothetical protein